MSDETKLVAGPLTAEMVPLLTEQSVLTKCAGLAIVRFEGWHLNEVWKRPDVIAGAEIVPHYMFNYLGEITPDGWIEAPEGGWEHDLFPDKRGVEIKISARAMYQTHNADEVDWSKVHAFRPPIVKPNPRPMGVGRL